MPRKTIFTERERKARHRIACRFWCRTNPVASRANVIRYRATHPDMVAKWNRTQHRKLARSILAGHLRSQGIEVTPQNIEAKRQQVQAHRAKRVLRMIYATSQITG